MRKVGGYLPHWAGIELKERMRLFRNAGFEFICLSSVGVNKTNPDSPSLETALEFGFEVQNVHLTGNGTNHVWLEGVNGEDIVKRYCDEITAYAALGVKIGITHVTWGSNVVTPPVCQLGIDRFKRIEECAAKNNFILALENSVTSEHLYAVINSFEDKEHSGYCYDSGHWYCYTPQADFIRDFGDRMVAMHLDDNDGIYDIHLLPFDGIAPWDRIITDLGKTPLYNDYVILEVNGVINRKYLGLDVAEIRKRLAKVAIIDDERLMTVRDGSITVYDKLTYEEYLDRMYTAALKIAGRS